MHVLLDENLPYRLRQLFENSIEQDLRKRHLGRKHPLRILQAKP